MNARAWLVRLYPRDWRERYGEEFEALLEECMHSPLDMIDVALGALDAHLGAFHQGDWRIFTMVNKLRTSILFVFTAYIAFVLAGFSLVGLLDDSPVAALMKAGATGLSNAWNTIAAAAVIALLAVIAGGLPLAITLIRQAFTSSRRTLRLLLVPVVAFLALVIYVLFMASVGQGWVQLPGVTRVVSPDNFPLGNKLVLGGAMLVFVIGAIVSVVAVWKAVTGLEGTESEAGGPFNSPRTYNYAFTLAGVVSLAMLVMLVTTLVFGWLANSALPDWFSSNMGLLLTNTGASYALTVTVMVLATTLALFGWLRGLSARKAA